MGAGLGRAPHDDELTPIVPQLRVRVMVESATLDAFVEEYHRFVHGDRIFIATDVLESPGNVVQFRIDLADGTALVHGTGTVLWRRARPHDGLPRGMVLRFVALDERSAKLIDRMLLRRAMTTPSRGVAQLDDGSGVVQMEAPPAGSDEPTPLRVREPEPTAPFRLLGDAPDAAQRWHTTSAERDAVLPANPFGDVPEVALAYFVDWSLERNGSTSWAAPGAVDFHRVRMRAPRRRRRGPPRWAVFAAGVVLGGTTILAATDVARALLATELGRARAGATAPPTSPVAIAPSTSAATAPPSSAASAAAAATAPPSSAPSAAATPPAATNSAPAPATKATSDATRAAARHGDAPLSITAEPAAHVLLDGARVGHTPLVLHVAPGPHTVTLSRPRYATADVEVRAPGGVAAHLERPRATLHVTADAPGAVLFVDGDSIGPTPISADVAGYERADVEVRAAGGRAWRKRIYVKPPLTDVHATLGDD